MFLLVHGVIYWLISWLGYTFIPVYETLQVGIILAITLTLTIDGFRTRRDRTRFSRIANALLPIIALYFVISFADHGGESPLYLLLFLTAFVCSMVLFFAHAQSRTLKLTLGVLHSLILIIPMLIFTLALVSSLFSEPSNYAGVKQAALSPSGAYLAEVVENTAPGTVGGNTWIYVTGQGRSVNILVGELRLRPQRIHTGHWVVVTDVTLHWETDEIVHITFSDKYGEDTISFRRQGRDWVRLHD